MPDFKATWSFVLEPENDGSRTRLTERFRVSDDGKFLLNPRNGYRYPIRNGIPVMLLEEAEETR